MYDQFYHFKSEPFRLSPDHAFAYSHKGFNKARAYMTYAFNRAEGFVMITGRPGTGKTTLIGALVDDLARKDVSVAHLVCTQLQADDLLKMVAYEFGIPVAIVEKGELLQRLTQQFRSWHRDGRRALLIVDEAQSLSVPAMEELRLLTNIQVGGKPLLQIFLLGQPELRELILSPALEQVHQRIVAASHLQALAMEETQAYIMHRLEVVGWYGDPVISQAIFPLVYKFSEGIPRRINLICSRLLLHCAVEERHRVGVADVQAVVSELQGERLAAGASFAAADFAVDDLPNPDTDHGACDGGDDTIVDKDGDATSSAPQLPAAHTAAPAEAPVRQQAATTRTPQRQRLTMVANGGAGAEALRANDAAPPGFDQCEQVSDEYSTDEIVVFEWLEAVIVQEAAVAAPAKPAPQRGKKASGTKPAAGNAPAPPDKPTSAAQASGKPLAPPASQPQTACGPSAGQAVRATGSRFSFKGSWVVLLVLSASVGLVLWGAYGFGLGLLTQ